MLDGSYNSYYFDGPLGPAEQDIVDVIGAVAARHLIVPARVYLTGFSMGGFGTLGIGARRPGVFAAIAPGAPFSDGFQQWQYIENGMAGITLRTVAGGTLMVQGGVSGTGTALSKVWV